MLPDLIDPSGGGAEGARRPTAPGRRRGLRDWWANESGTSAVEFALLGPALFLGLLAMVDIGLAVNERMALDHVLRAGAQRAMADPGTASVLAVVNATAEKNFTLSTNNVPPVPNPLTVSVTRFCACPNQTGVAVACATICTGPKPTFVYYRLTGTKAYKGMLVPSITAQPAVQVQTR